MAAAHDELNKLLQDRRDFPINYNHYYTDTITAMRRDRLQKQLLEKSGSLNTKGYSHVEYVKMAFDKWRASSTADMEEFSCEEALNCLLAIYKVSKHLRKKHYTLAPMVVWKVFNMPGSFAYANITITDSSRYNKRPSSPTLLPKLLSATLCGASRTFSRPW